MADNQTAEKQPANGKDHDPMNAFREMRDGYLDAWAKAMIETVNTDAYAKATGMMLETALTAYQPFREALEKVMPQTLQQLDLPSRGDFISLAQRVTHIEMKLDDMEDALDRIEKLLAKPVVVNAAAAAPARRTRKKGAK
jgi:hypothetical protein